MPSFPSQKQCLPEAQRATYFLAYAARKRLTERQFRSLLWLNHLWWLWSPQRSYLGQVILFGDVPILELNMVARRFVGFCWQVYSPSWELEIICSQFYINFKAKILGGQIYQRKIWELGVMDAVVHCLYLSLRTEGLDSPVAGTFGWCWIQLRPSPGILQSEDAISPKILLPSWDSPHHITSLCGNTKACPFSSMWTTSMDHTSPRSFAVTIVQVHFSAQPDLSFTPLTGGIPKSIPYDG